MGKELETFAHRSGPTVVDLGSGTASHQGMRRAGAITSSPGGASVVRSLARPYHPLFSSPDRLQLPTQLAQLNQYWRMFYNMDPIIGAGIDLISELPFSSAYLKMDQVGDRAQTIMNTFEDSLNESELVSFMPKMVREYLTLGEVFPYAHWSEEEGIFNHLSLLNQDTMDVVDSPLIDDEPIVTMRPSQEMRRILTSTDPRYIRLRTKLPREMLGLIAGGRNIPLDPINVSHIARKAFGYDIRGTSLMARMFRILMYEDAVFSGQIQQAQRHSLPLRVFKLGDPQTQWIPTVDNQEDFASILAECEADPLSALVWNYALQVEYHGMEGKQLKLTQEWDIISEVKFCALGINKALLNGETSYASVNSAMQIFMSRLRNLRDMMERDWVYRKYFVTMSELNGFWRKIKKTDDEHGLPPSRTPEMQKQTSLLNDKLQKIAEISDPGIQQEKLLEIQGEVRQQRQLIAKIEKVCANDKRSQVHPKMKLIYPTIEWEKRLDVRQDEAILGIWQALAEKGWISPRSVVQGAGLDYDSEMATFAADMKHIIKNTAIMGTLSEGGGGIGGGGAGLLAGALGGGGEGPPGGAGGPPGSEGDMAGEGHGAPGSGPMTGPTASRRRRRKITAAELPPDVKREVQKVLSDSGSENFYTGNH